MTILLHDEEDAGAVAAALASPGVTALTWRELNQVFLSTMDTAHELLSILDFIVILVVAVVIANTLLMAVFERGTRNGHPSALA